MREMLNEKKAEIKAAAGALLARAETENRQLTDAEEAEFQRFMEDGESVERQLDRAAKFNEDARKLSEHLSGTGTGTGGAEARAVKFINRNTGAPALRSNQLFGEHELVVAHRERGRLGEEAAMATYGGSIVEMVRSLSTTGASAVVPTVWASQIIDVARANAAVMKAGATILPMDASTVQVGRLTGDVTAAFRAEGSAINASDPTFDNVTLTAKSLNALVVGSVEWFDDAPNADGLVINSIGKAIGLMIDKVALYGGITTGAGSVNLPTPPNPRGVLAALNANRPANVIGAAATNGTTPTSYDELIDLDYTVENLNEHPTGLILPSRLAQKYAKFKDTTNQPMRKPDDLSDLPFYVSNQVQSGMTQGTSTTAADAFVGDWTELLIGQRLGLQIQVLTERYAELGQIGIVATWRGDIQPARTSAFAVYRYLVGL
ncbi:phage major capsid protein [Arthrobacter sp. FW306-2-2C-D06B]|uniref:phage major capsid protein n=1 Tax=Arthrobacter sp. FW306-2-2C-D06B TaxID=2879618 RepID=UPI001F001FE6|nr:phage major capsid protein [Arthrobacter sp. FW306-2-2C-D06B]UKA57514.1 phage major capsid protein [Arthrobacter sp. FW306-2-2C-D06B]